MRDGRLIETHRPEPQPVVEVGLEPRSGAPPVGKVVVAAEYELHISPAIGPLAQSGGRKCGVDLERLAAPPHEMPVTILDRSPLQRVFADALVAVEDHRERHRALTPACAFDQGLCGRTLGGIGRRPSQLLVKLAPQTPRGHGAPVAGEALDPREWEHAVVEDAGLQIAGVEASQRLLQLVLDGTREGSPRDQEGERDGHERQSRGGPETEMRSRDAEHATFLASRYA